jgi:hypothetical protein
VFRMAQTEHPHHVSRCAHSSCVQTRRFPSLPRTPFGALDAYLWQGSSCLREQQRPGQIRAGVGSTLARRVRE